MSESFSLCLSHTQHTHTDIARAHAFCKYILPPGTHDVPLSRQRESDCQTLQVLHRWITTLATSPLFSRRLPSSQVSSQDRSTCRSDWLQYEEKQKLHQITNLGCSSCLVSSLESWQQVCIVSRRGTLAWVAKEIGRRNLLSSWGP